MARFLNKPISVTMGRVEGWLDLAPISFILFKERHIVARVLDCFRMRWTPWWEDPSATARGPEEADVWRVETTKHGVFELVQIGTSWLAYKAYD